MQRWDTSERATPEQYSYWREVVCEAFTPLRPAALGARDAWNRGGLQGWVEARRFGEVNGAEISTCDQTIHHGASEVERVEQEVVFVNLMLKGRCVVSQDGASCLSGPGTFSIVDASRPYRLDYLDTWRTISFRVPASQLPDGVAPGTTAVRYSADHGLASVLADTMRAAWRAAPSVTTEQATWTGTAVASLVSALVAREPADADPSPASWGPAASAAMRERIERFVDGQLLYTDVSPATVARHVGISVRKLHLLYQDAPATYSQTVMRMRAQRCAEDLLATRGTLTLTDLAAKWGFSDLSHLNRVFVRHFGCRASEYARDGVPGG